MVYFICGLFLVQRDFCCRQREFVCIGGNFFCYFYLFIYLFRFLAPSAYDNIIHQKQKDFKQNFELLAFIYSYFLGILIFFGYIYIYIVVPYIIPILYVPFNIIMLLNKILISKSCILYNDQIVKLYWPTKQNRVPDKVSRERTKYIAIDHSHSWTIQISVTNVCALFEKFYFVNYK